MGVPVIATNWSGHTLFVNDTTAWPVPLAGLACIDNVDAAGLYARHRWAEPSVAALRSIMRRHVEGGGLKDAEVAALGAGRDARPGLCDSPYGAPPQVKRGRQRSPVGRPQESGSESDSDGSAETQAC